MNAVEIATGILQGDADAEKALIDTYGPMLLKLLERQNVPSPEDICQEALMVVLVRLRDRPIDDPERLPQFLRRTALNINLREVRRDIRRNTRADDELIANVLTWRGPEYRFLQARKKEMLQEVIAELSQERDRQVLDLYYIEEWEKPEICDVLGLSDSNISNVLHRARMRLKERLQALESEQLEELVERLANHALDQTSGQPS